MNIPLNIDWQQILLHLLNFSILTLGLYLLLYNPIRKFMKKRTDYYHALDSDAENKLKQVTDLEKSYQERLQHFETEIAEKKLQAMQEAQQGADAILQRANKEAEELLSETREAAMRERAKISEDTQKEVVSLAFAAAEKMIAQSSSDTLDQFIYAVKQE
ncbi:MAG: ATP synthase F0 subunit B [Christensenellales bacterium]|jgi:F-type H+-transporting ATPase subunit b